MEPLTPLAEAHPGPVRSALRHVLYLASADLTSRNRRGAEPRHIVPKIPDIDPCPAPRGPLAEPKCSPLLSSLPAPSGRCLSEALPRGGVASRRRRRDPAIHEAAPRRGGPICAAQAAPPKARRGSSLPRCGALGARCGARPRTGMAYLSGSKRAGARARPSWPWRPPCRERSPSCSSAGRPIGILAPTTFSAPSALVSPLAWPESSTNSASRHPHPTRRRITVSS